MAAHTCKIEGYEEVEDEIKKLRLRKLTYTIFEISRLDPVELHVKASGGMDISSDLRRTPSEKELLNIFTECKSQLSENRASFIAYNFGYYNEKANYRELIMLNSFIPEGEGLRKKIAMSSNVAAIQNSLQIPIHIESHELDEFGFERLKTECLYIQRK